MTAISTVDQFCDYLTERRIAFERDGSSVSVKGALWLTYLTALPEGVHLSAGAVSPGEEG